MTIRRCTDNDVELLAELNKQLIEDEKSDNTMSVEELESRMSDFLSTEYEAYFFLNEEEVVGYALVKKSVTPYYIRQFFIQRKFRRQHIGLQAFQMLLKELGTENVDIDVLSWNEVGIKFWEKCGFSERSRYMRLKRS